MGIAARIAGLTLALALFGGVGHPAAAQGDGLEEVGVTTWTVLPDEGVVTASIDLRLRNTVADTPAGRTYFDGYGIAVPMPPDTVEVTSGGSPVTTELTTLDDGTPAVEWRLPQRLFRDERQTFQVDLRFESAPPRSDFDAGPRVTPAFVMVPIWAWGPDDADLVVRVPTDLAARLGFSGPDARANGRDVFRRDDAASFSEFLVGASDAGERDRNSIEVDGTTIVVEAWPDDPAWGRRVSRFARRALPELAAWTSTPWADDTITIRETAQPVVEGWGGWNDPDANEISVGEEFDPALWTHELAHNWIDEEQFSDTWLLEGMAETITAFLADDLKISQPPTPAPSKQPLAEWNDILANADQGLADDPDSWFETTNDLYAGAHFVVGSVADEVGEEAFREMVRMTLNDESAWGDLGTAVPGSAADWREFLDLAERVGGSTSARDLILERVRPGSEELLDQRDDAIEQFARIEDDPWGVPSGITSSMHVWRFDEAEERINRALAVRPDIQELTERAEDLGCPLPSLQEVWLSRSMSVVADRVAALDLVLDDVEALYAEADQADLSRPVLALDPAVDDATTMARRVAKLRSAITRVERADRALAAADRNPVVTVGLVGADPDALLERARNAFAEGALDAVAATTTQVETLLDDAASQGRARLGGAIAGVILLAALLAMAVMWRRRRRQRAPQRT